MTAPKAARLYGVRLEALPPEFRAQVEKYASFDVGKDGIWRTYASNEDEALRHCSDIVHIVSGVRIDPSHLHVEPVSMVASKHGRGKMRLPPKRKQPEMA